MLLALVIEIVMAQKDIFSTMWISYTIFAKNNATALSYKLCQRQKRKPYNFITVEALQTDTLITL